MTSTTACYIFSKISILAAHFFKFIVRGKCKKVLCYEISLLLKSITISLIWKMLFSQKFHFHTNWCFFMQIKTIFLFIYWIYHLLHIIWEEFRFHPKCTFFIYSFWYWQTIYLFGKVSSNIIFTVLYPMHKYTKIINGFKLRLWQ